MNPKICPIVFLLTSLFAASASATPVDFDREVQPILAAKCFLCHGPDEGKRKAGLRLDDDKGMYAPLKDGGLAVVGGDRSKSLLWVRINATDTEEKMPPATAPKQLTAEEIETLGRWIDEGGKWEQHWSLRPLTRPDVPQVADAGWARNDIDRFVFAKLAEHGMRPAPEADRRTLIRRLSFDLLGLPPTPEEVAAFENDTDPAAYEALVDRLLASPRYGERWGRHWLDVAHYGETHGYDKDKRRPNSWPYRDYVIRAFNDDKPYGEFVREQVAGDVLNPNSPDGVIATGFIAAGPWDFVGQVELKEGTTDKNITRLLDRDDMVSSVMGTFTSTTVHCARCHDHKFDPISQKDYYALQADFAGVDRANREYDDDPVVHRKRQEWLAEKRTLQTKKDALDAQANAVDTPERKAADEKLATLKGKLAELSGSPSNGYHSAIEAKQDVTKWVQVDLGEAMPLDKVRLVPAMPTDFPDTPGFGMPVRYKVEIASAEDFSDAVVIKDETGADVPNMAGQTVGIDVDGKTARYVRVTVTKLWQRTNDYIFALGELEAVSAGRNVARGKAVTALDSIEAGRWGTKNLVDGYDSRHPLTVATNSSAQDVMAEMDAAKAARDSAIATALGDGFVKEQTEVAAALEDVDARLKALPKASVVFAASHDFSAEGNFTPAKPVRPVFVLARGDVNQPKDPATAGALSCVDTMPARFDLRDENDEGMRRAALAYWLSDSRNPLTWRSIANRVWHYHFGKGIVETPNDFGRMGAAPTHPELLDWLATELLDKEESLKALTREIVMSATYRQACVDNPDYAAKDGNNQYLWRANRQLLDAESLRDSILMVSGKLDLTMGGPGYDLFGFEDDHSPRYKYEEHDPTDAKSFRRSVYRFIVRSVPDPLFDTLDCADASQSVPVRNTTITALQALALLNDRFLLQQANYFADRVSADGGDLPTQLDAAIRIALGRDAKPDEKASLATYAQSHGLPAACRLILNMNEFSFVD